MKVSKWEYSEYGEEHMCVLIACIVSMDFSVSMDIDMSETVHSLRRL